MTTSKKPTAQAVKEQTVAQAIANVDAKKKAMMPDLNVSKGGSTRRGEVMYLPSELGNVQQSTQTEVTSYGYFHLCNERGLTAGEVYVSKQDINDVVIVDHKIVNGDEDCYTWFNFKTGQTHYRTYKQDTFAQYTANKKRYKVMAKQR